MASTPLTIFERERLERERWAFIVAHRYAMRARAGLPFCILHPPKPTVIGRG